MVENETFQPFRLIVSVEGSTIDGMGFIGIIADIVDSRSKPDRGQLQQDLVELLDDINTSRQGVLASPFTVTLGDEFQALYNAPAGLFADLWHISAALYPVRLRYSVALGELTTPLNESGAIGMDGPVFHAARAGIKDAKELKAMFRIGGKVPNLRLINHTLMLISHMVRDWNANRLAIMADLIAGRSVTEIAHRVGISKSGVYKNINAAALDTISAMTGDIECVLAEGLGA